jgi:putative oxidoreductase
MTPRNGDRIMKYTVLLGRILFSLIFILAGINHFSRYMIEHGAAQGIPWAEMAIPLSGVVLLLGGLSIALGYKAQWGARLIVLFLIPTTLMMHNFWAFSDAALAQTHQVMFMKNLSMMGGALLISYFGSGPLSLDARKKTNPAQAARDIKHGTAATV